MPLRKRHDRMILHVLQQNGYRIAFKKIYRKKAMENPGMPCERCTGLYLRYRIYSASDLRKCIRTTLQGLHDGSLRELRSAEQDASPSLHELAQGAAWQQVASINFECQTCGQGFRLKRDASDGAGGYWEPA